jgi:hypothetical protein
VLYRLMMFVLTLNLVGAPLAFAGQALKDDTEKEHAKRAAETSPIGQRDEPATRVEKFLARKNVLLTKETYAIGSIPGQQGAEVKVEALVLSAAGEAAKVYGLSLIRFSNRAGERQSQREVVGFIDFDEVTALQNALDAVVKAAEANSEANAAAKNPAANDSRTEESQNSGPATEFSLTTRSGLKTGMLQIGRQQTGFVQFKVEAQDATVFFGTGALGRLRNLIAQARSKLLSLGAR